MKLFFKKKLARKRKKGETEGTIVDRGCERKRDNDEGRYWCENGGEKKLKVSGFRNGSVKVLVKVTKEKGTEEDWLSGVCLLARSITARAVHTRVSKKSLIEFPPAACPPRASDSPFDWVQDCSLLYKHAYFRETCLFPWNMPIPVVLPTPKTFAQGVFINDARVSTKDISI